MPTAWRYRHSIGTSDGSIIATIITTHMPRNDTAAPDHVCPGIRIHAIDIVQPPGSASRPSPTWTCTRRSSPPRSPRRAALRRPRTNPSPPRAARAARRAILHVSRASCASSSFLAPSFRYDTSSRSDRREPASPDYKSMRTGSSVASPKSCSSAGAASRRRVARRLHTPGMRPPRALRAGRIAALGVNSTSGTRLVDRIS